MKTLAHIRPIVVASLLFVSAISGLRAANGTYTNATTGGTWSNSLNWSGGTIADGADFTASFIADLTTANTVTLDTSRTIGNLVFTDSTSPGATNIWTLAASGGSVLTLATTSGTPTITVNNTGFVSTISAPLAGSQGFTKAGAGQLQISNTTSTAYNQLAGEILVTQGTLNPQNVSGTATTISMPNAWVNLGNGTSLVVGSNGGSGAGVGGLMSTGTNGTISVNNGLRFLNLGGNSNYSFGGVLSAASNTNTIQLNVNLSNGGSQTFTNTANAYRGLNVVNAGSLISASAITTGTPFGTGGVQLSNTGAAAAAISIAPTAGSGDVAYTGASIATATGAVVVATFTYGNGAQLLLDKGSANSLSYTVGAAAAPANSILIRSAAAASTNASNQGTLILGAASGTAALGTATGEKFIVNGGVTTLNGIASASIIGRDGAGNKSGTFLGYGASGFQQATYSVSTDINGGTAFADTRVFDATGSTTNVLSADASVYALRTSGQTVSGNFILSVGDSTAGTAGGVILNGGAINTSGLAFSTDAAGVIYTSAANGSISAAITNIASGNNGRGVTFEGPGVLTLSGSNTFRGGAFINDSTVAITNNNQLGVIDSAVLGKGSVTLRGGTLQTTVDGVAIADRAITLNRGVSGGGGTFDVTTGNTTITNASGANLKIISGTGTLTKTGTGTLSLAGDVANTYTGKTLVSVGTLILNTSAGGAAISSTGATGYSAAATDIQITGGTLQLGASDQIRDTSKLALSGGTFDLNGKSEGTAGTAGLGNFTLSSTSTLDFGASDNSNILQFAGVDTHVGGVLQIINWNGTATTGGGSERLLFMGTDTAAFTGLYSQTDVSFNGTVGYNAVSFGTYYEITAVPEPSTVTLLIASAGGILLWAKRRRSL